MKLSISVTGLDAVRRQLGDLGKQASFAASKALNATAQDLRRAIPGELRKSLDRPTDFTASEKAMFIRPATKNRLESVVQFKDRQASYLRYQIDGGVRQPTRKALRLPSAIGLDQHGNLPRGIIKQLVIPLIVFPEQAAKYEKRVDLKPLAEKVMRESFGPAFERELRLALKSARV